MEHIKIKDQKKKKKKIPKAYSLMENSSVRPSLHNLYE